MSDWNLYRQLQEGEVVQLGDQYVKPLPGQGYGWNAQTEWAPVPPEMVGRIVASPNCLAHQMFRRLKEHTVIFHCTDIGLAGTTPVHVRDNGDGTFTARRGFALFGTTNMSDAEFEACGYNPFHPNFNDNYSEGSGSTAAEAVEALKRDTHQTAESLWA